MSFYIKYSTIEYKQQSPKCSLYKTPFVYILNMKSVTTLCTLTCLTCRFKAVRNFKKLLCRGDGYHLYAVGHYTVQCTVQGIICLLLYAEQGTISGMAHVSSEIIHSYVLLFSSFTILAFLVVLKNNLKYGHKELKTKESMTSQID